MKYTLYGIIGIVVLVAGFALLQSDNLGSVAVSNEYTIERISSDDANTDVTVHTSACTLGSVVIASTSDTALTIMDAATTTDAASTTIAVFPASATVGTYTYDIACQRGLIIEVPSGFTGDYAVTHRR